MAQTRLPANLRREQMLDACRSVVDDEGFHAVTINRIAQDCGVTRTVVYQQFGSLQAMLISLVEREFDRAAQGFLAAMTAAPQEGPTTATAQEPTFRSAMAGVFASVDADTATWRMFMMPSEGGPPELYEHLRRARVIALGYVAEAVTAAGAESKAIDAELTARTLHVMADELVRLRLTAPDEYSVARLLDHAERASAALLAG